MTIKEFKPGTKITKEEIEQWSKNREGYPKYMQPSSEGVYYPIPKLENAYRSILIDEDTTGAEDFTLGFCRFEPGASHEPHAHAECEECAYMISGRFVGGVAKDMDDPGVEIIWEPGDILFVPRGYYHWFYNPFDEPQTHVFMYTRKSLKTAGYSIQSQGFKEIGGDIEKLQQAGENK